MMGRRGGAGRSARRAGEDVCVCGGVGGEGGCYVCGFGGF